MASMSSSDVAMGTVDAQCFPDFRMATACLAWSGMGVTMWTASMLLSFSASSSDFQHLLMVMYLPQ